jgi:DNA mismatch repair protein MutL
VREQVAISLSRASAMNYAEELQPGQMDQMVDQLFACTSPNYTPDGKTVVTIIPLEEVEKLFGR